MTHYDILIVGSGLIGATFAYKANQESLFYQYIARH